MKCNELKILCNIWNKNKNKKQIYNNQLYKWCNCKTNLCPLCRLSHNKEHILIDYDLKITINDDSSSIYDSLTP